VAPQVAAGRIRIHHLDASKPAWSGRLTIVDERTVLSGAVQGEQTANGFLSRGKGSITDLGHREMLETEVVGAAGDPAGGSLYLRG
jgi:hypothetical protein